MKKQLNNPLHKLSYPTPEPEPEFCPSCDVLLQPDMPMCLTPGCRYRRPTKPTQYLLGKIGGGTFQITAYATGGRVSVKTTLSGVMTEYVNTAAGTHDNNDLTFDACAAEADPAVSNGFLRVEYIFTPIVASRISFVTVRMKASCDSVGGTASINPSYSGIAGNSQSVPTGGTTLPTWFQSNFLVNPSSGGPWTAAAINTGTWGARISVAAPDAGTAQTIYLHELELVINGNT